MFFLQSYVIMPRVGLRETEIKRICQISGVRVFEQEFSTNKTVIYKVVSYGGDCLGEVVAMRKLTIVLNSTPSTSKIWRDLWALLGGQSYTWQGTQETHS